MDFNDLKKMGVVLKRALYFITCKGKAAPYVKIDRDHAERYLIASEKQPLFSDVEQTSLFDTVTKGDVYKCVSGQM